MAIIMRQIPKSLDCYVEQLQHASWNPNDQASSACKTHLAEELKASSWSWCPNLFQDAWNCCRVVGLLQRGTTCEQNFSWKACNNLVRLLKASEYTTADLIPIEGPLHTQSIHAPPIESMIEKLGNLWSSCLICTEKSSDPVSWGMWHLPVLSNWPACDGGSSRKMHDQTYKVLSCLYLIGSWLNILPIPWSSFWLEQLLREKYGSTRSWCPCCLPKIGHSTFSSTSSSW